MAIALSGYALWIFSGGILVLIIWFWFFSNNTEPRTNISIRPKTIITDQSTQSKHLVVNQQASLKAQFDGIEKDIWIRNQLDRLDNSFSIYDIVKYKAIHQLTYSDLLECFEWRFKRLQVLIRDKYKCQKCLVVSEYNHVHHTYYLKNRLPWQIELTALITLCKDCHHKLHKNEIVKLYEIKHGVFVESSHFELYCYRCNGSGYLPQFKHVENGICFACWGSCINRTIFSEALTAVKKIGLSDSYEKERQYYRNFLNAQSTEGFVQNMAYSKSKSTSTDDLPF